MEIVLIVDIGARKFQVMYIGTQFLVSFGIWTFVFVVLNIDLLAALAKAQNDVHKQYIELTEQIRSIWQLLSQPFGMT